MTTPTDTDLAQALRLLIVAHEEVLGDGLTSFNEPVELRRAKQALAAHESRAQPDRNPDGCAYRYRCPDGGTVIRFNHGEAVNGSKPIETIPFYYGQPPAQPASVAVWQPIETAPKDDTTVLTWSVLDDINISHRHQSNPALGGKPYWIVRQGRNDWVIHPTHWMPLPAAPQPAKENE